MDGLDLTRAAWRKSARSAGNGGQCVEVAAVWRKSSRSGGNGGSCVEAAPRDGRAVAIRDSKDPHGPTLAATPRAWDALVGGLKRGAFGA